MSAIGLATSPTLDPADPAYRWTDHGPVIQSAAGSAFNTIDPSVFQDSDGSLWMSFGSYWSGIYLVQLDPRTGLRVAPDSPLHHLAHNGSIEASCVYRRGPWYYLFVNWGSCCSGLSSTYQIRVGRSANVAGPYLDRNGKDLRSGGGTLFLEASGRYVGPGHVGVIESEAAGPWFTFHFYDASAYAPWYGGFGAAKFDFAPLSFDAQGWPAVQRDWSANYEFDADAEDLGGRYYGILKNGAQVENNAALGGVLCLDGEDDHVVLPAGVAYARTFAAVVKWEGGGAWQRVFDFGVDTQRWLFLSPADQDRRIHFAIAPDRSIAVQTLWSSVPFPTNEWCQVVVTLDGARGTLYLNGAAIATNTSMSYSPVEVRAQTNYLGRSFWTADPYFNGRFSSFRVYARALPASEIAAPHPRIQTPARGGSCHPGELVIFQGSAADFLDRPLPQSALAWRVEWIRNEMTNVMLASAGVSEGSYRLPDALTNGVLRFELTAVDPQGRRRSVATDLQVSADPTSGPWTSFYPFTANALDASNRFSGSLAGGASVVSDPEFGRVLHLPGVSGYVALPAGASTLRTFAGWVFWNGGDRWQRVFDFGTGTDRWFFCTPRNGADRLEIMSTTVSSVYMLGMEAPFMFPSNRWVHLAVVLDGNQGILYLDGEAIAVNNSLTLLPADVGATRAWFGRSQYTADRFFSGRLDSIHLSSKAMSGAEVRNLFRGGPVPPSLTVGRTSSGLSLGWPAWARDWHPQSRLQIGDSTAAWSPLTNAPLVTDDSRVIHLPVAGSSHFFRLAR